MKCQDCFYFVRFRKTPEKGGCNYGLINVLADADCVFPENPWDLEDSVDGPHIPSPRGIDTGAIRKYS